MGATPSLPTDPDRCKGAVRTFVSGKGMMLWGFSTFPPLCVAEAVGVCPTDHPAAREPAHHGERHADQLLPDRRLPQQPLGLDWPVQGDVAGGQGAHQSHPPTGLSILSAHGSWAQRLQSYPHPPQGSLPIEGLAVKGKRQVV